MRPRPACACSKARIRSGDVAIDLYRPVGLIGWYLAADLGRALYHLLSRGLAPMLVGLALFDLTMPPSVPNAAAFLVSVPLAVTISFALRFLVACTAFWLLDANGVRLLADACAIFFSGVTLPLVLFPGWLGTLAESLPWAGILQVPADLWLGRHDGTAILAYLGFQLGWIAILLGCCALVLRAATRRVVVQGG